MAEQTHSDETSQQLAQKIQIYEAVANAYGFVHGQEQIRALMSKSFGDILQSRIDEIKGPHPYGLPTRLEELDQIKRQFEQAVAELRAQEDSNV